MKKVLFLALLAAVPFLYTACDQIGVEKEDRIRFDFEVDADSVDILIEDSLFRPYDTEELSRYRDARDGIQEYEIRMVTFRFHSFEDDHPDNVMRGTLTFRSPRNTYTLVPFETGTEYKDTKEHEVYSITVNGNDDKEAAYNTLAQDIVDYDEFHIGRANGNFYPGPLKCLGSVYVYYRIKGS